MALDVAQQYALRRANRQQHDGIHPHTSYLILKARPLQIPKNLPLLCDQHSGSMAWSEPHQFHGPLVRCCTSAKRISMAEYMGLAARSCWSLELVITLKCFIQECVKDYMRSRDM